MFAAAFGISAPGCRAPDQGPVASVVGSDAYSLRDDELHAEVETRAHAIRAEIDALGPDHPWAGLYAWGDGLSGLTVSVAPKAGCLLVERGCLGICEVNWGAVTERDQRLVVTFELPEQEREARRRYAPEFIIEGSGLERCLRRIRADDFEVWLCRNREDGMRKSIEAGQKNPR